MVIAALRSLRAELLTRCTTDEQRALVSGVAGYLVRPVTVDVIKGKRIGWPRGESAEYIFTAGNARPPA